MIRYYAIHAIYILYWTYLWALALRTFVLYTRGISKVKTYIFGQEAQKRQYLKILQLLTFHVVIKYLVFMSTKSGNFDNFYDGIIMIF